MNSDGIDTDCVGTSNLSDTDAASMGSGNDSDDDVLRGLKGRENELNYKKRVNITLNLPTAKSTDCTPNDTNIAAPSQRTHHLSPMNNINLLFHGNKPWIFNKPIINDKDSIYDDIDDIVWSEDRVPSKLFTDDKEKADIMNRDYSGIHIINDLFP